MKYALLIYDDESVCANMNEDEKRRVYEEHAAYGQAMSEAGVLRGGEELALTSSASTVRFANGKPSLMDGPFAETREQLGGFYMIEVDDLDQALAWAKRMPGINSGCVEVRPVGGDG